MSSSFPLPSNLPEPLDDGACRHLPGLSLPPISLASTAGCIVNIQELAQSRTVIYCYPMTGVPGKALPIGWDAIPGARGCTPQAGGFRDHFAELSSCGVQIFGLSTQTTEYQRELVDRLDLPFEVLSDAEFRFCDGLRLPTFNVETMRLVKRLTLIIRRGLIETVFYPVFPPHTSVDRVLNWLRDHPA
jgi:peroxiredoxin